MVGRSSSPSSDQPHEGFPAGLFFAFGVFISDASLIALGYLFAGQLDLLNAPRPAGMGGGFRPDHLRRLADDPAAETEDRWTTTVALVSHYIGSRIPDEHPQPDGLLFWLSVVGYRQLTASNTACRIASPLFGSVLGTVLSADLLKILWRRKTEAAFLNAQVMKWINRITRIDRGGDSGGNDRAGVPAILNSVRNTADTSLTVPLLRFLPSVGDARDRVQERSYLVVPRPGPATGVCGGSPQKALIDDLFPSCSSRKGPYWMTVSPIGRPCNNRMLAGYRLQRFQRQHRLQFDSIVAWDRRRSYANALSFESSESYG